MSRWVATGAFVVLLVFLALGDPQPAMGDADEYLAMAHRLSQGYPPPHKMHFWFYPALAAPIVRAVALAGLPERLAFIVLNVVLLAGAFRLVLDRLGAPGTVFLFVSPILWWIDKPHTEVFTFSLLATAMVLFDRAPWWSLVALGAAATQNPPVGGVLALAMLVGLVRRQVRRDRRFWGAGFVACLLAGSHPVYYLLTEQRLSPLLALTSRRLPTWQELGAVLWDPSIGLFWCFAPVLPVLLAAGLRITTARRWSTVWRSFAAPMAAGAAVIFLLSFASTMNVRHGGTPGMSRYALWLIPLAVPVLATPDTGRPTSRPMLAFILFSAAWSLVLFHPRIADSAMIPSPAARFLWTRYPSLDNPLPEVFSESLAGEQFHLLPVATAGCEKILLLSTGGADGMWPVPCRPSQLPPDCSPWGALCYANRSGRGYRFVPIPPRYPGYRVDPGRVWPRDAEALAARLLDGAKWWEMSAVPEGDAAMLREVSGASGVCALQGPAALVVYFAETDAGARLVVRPAVPMRGEFIDVGARTVLQRVLVDGRVSPSTELAVPGPASHVLLVLAR